MTNGLSPAIVYSQALMCSYKQAWGLTRGRAGTRLGQERHLGYKGVITSQNCASQCSPKISIGLELHSAENIWNDVGRKLLHLIPQWFLQINYVQGPMADTGVSRTRAQFSRASHTEGWVRPAVTVLAGSHTGPAGKGEKLLLEETSSRKCFTYIGTFGLGLERWVAFLFPPPLVVIYPIYREEEKESNAQQQ